MADFTTPELDEIRFKLKIADMIIKEAQVNGDERWREVARQADELNEQRAVILKAERKKRGIEIENITIQTRQATSKAKGIKNG